MKQWITALVGLSLLAVGCADDTASTSVATVPEVTVEQQAVTSTVVETPSTTAEPEPVEDTEEVTPEPGEAAEKDDVVAVAESDPVAEDVAAVEESLEPVTEGPVESETVEDPEIAVPEAGDVGSRRILWEWWRSFGATASKKRPWR